MPAGAWLRFMVVQEIRIATRRLRVFGIVFLACWTGACASHRQTLPLGPGSPFPDFEEAFTEVITRYCTLNTLLAELRLSGRVGDSRLRGRVLAGLAEPGAVRLEGLAPFGPPAFIFVAQPGRAALLMPRESRALVGPSAIDIVGALTGIALTPDDLRYVLSGCLPETVQARTGVAYGQDWWTIETSDSSLVYLRRVGDFRRIVAIRRSGWLSEYSELSGRVPAQVRLTSNSASGAVDLTVLLSQVRINTTLDAATFVLDIPPDAVPITLSELRARGPLRASVEGAGR